MPSTNVLANLFVTLYNNETRRKQDCIILPTSKLGIEVLIASSGDELLEDSDILVAATTDTEPLFDGERISEHDYRTGTEGLTLTSDTSEVLPNSSFLIKLT